MQSLIEQIETNMRKQAWHQPAAPVAPISVPPESNEVTHVESSPSGGNQVTLPGFLGPILLKH